MDYSIAVDDDTNALVYYDYNELVRGGAMPNENGRFKYINVGWVDDSSTEGDN